MICFSSKKKKKKKQRNPFALVGPMDAMIIKIHWNEKTFPLLNSLQKHERHKRWNKEKKKVTKDLKGKRKRTQKI